MIGTKTTFVKYGIYNRQKKTTFNRRLNNETGIIGNFYDHTVSPIRLHKVIFSMPLKWIQELGSGQL